MTESMSEIFLRYRGTSTYLEDQLTGLRWVRDGEAVAVSEIDAARLQQVSPYDIFEVVQAASVAQDDAAAEAEAAAQAPLKARIAEAEAAAEEAQATDVPVPAEAPAPDAPADPAPQDGANSKNSQEAKK